MKPLIDGVYLNAAGFRNYKLYVAAPRGDEAPPLFVMLHGCQQNAADFAAGTRMNELAEECGGVVLYPEQCTMANTNGCWNWHKKQHQSAGGGEPSLIAGMTRQVMAEHRIDAARVYVAGMSAGGAMAVILGQAYPDLYAAVGVHSGVPSGVAVDLMSALSAMNSGPTPSDRAAARRRTKGKHAIATIVFHGDRDRVVHPLNGEAVHTQARRPSGERRSQQAPKGAGPTERAFRSDDGAGRSRAPPSCRTASHRPNCGWCTEQATPGPAAVRMVLIRTRRAPMHRGKWCDSFCSSGSAPECSCGTKRRDVPGCTVAGPAASTRPSSPSADTRVPSPATLRPTAVARGGRPGRPRLRNQPFASLHAHKASEASPIGAHRLGAGLALPQPVDGTDYRSVRRSAEKRGADEEGLHGHSETVGPNAASTEHGALGTTHWPPTSHARRSARRHFG